MAWLSRAVASRQQLKSVVEPCSKRACIEQVHSCRGQLDCQWISVQPATEAFLTVAREHRRESDARR
jgi:hypothetical protein